MQNNLTADKENICWDCKSWIDLSMKTKKMGAAQMIIILQYIKGPLGSTSSIRPKEPYGLLHY
jgi:hypothetical protein